MIHALQKMYGEAFFRAQRGRDTGYVTSEYMTASDPLRPVAFVTIKNRRPVFRHYPKFEILVDIAR